VTIAYNRIRNNEYGIWLGTGGNVTATLHDNRFRRVGTHIVKSP
jgi:hypothetical protein